MGCGCGNKAKNGNGAASRSLPPALPPAGIGYQLTSEAGSVELYTDRAEALAAKMDGDALIAVRLPREPSPT